MFAIVSNLGEDLQRVVQSPLVASIVALITATGAIWAFYSKYLRTAKLSGLIACTLIFLTLAGLAYAGAKWFFPANKVQAKPGDPNVPPEKPEDPREKAYREFVQQGRELREKGFFDEAVAAFDKAIAAKADGTEATVGLTETKAKRATYQAEMKTAREMAGEEQYAKARDALTRALAAKPNDADAEKRLATVTAELATEAELTKWFALPLPKRPANAAVVLFRVDGDAEPDGVAKIQEKIEEQLTKAGKTVWRIGLKPVFARDQFDAVWSGDVMPDAWKHRLVGSKPPDLFLLVRLTLAPPEKAAFDQQSVRGTLRLRGVTGDGKPLPVQECIEVFAQVTARLATEGALAGLAKQVEDGGLVKKTLP